LKGCCHCCLLPSLLQAQQRFMAGWLKLQNEVNALIDSTAADNTDQSVSQGGA
jgi:hypothetical protein